VEHVEGESACPTSGVLSKYIYGPSCRVTNAIGNLRFSLVERYPPGVVVLFCSTLQIRIRDLIEACLVVPTAVEGSRQRRLVSADT